MWPFLRRQAKQGSPDNEAMPDQRARPMRFAQIIEGMGDCKDLKVHDVALKFWLPEPTAEAVKELCQRNGDSLSEALRQFFAQFCYGTYAFQVMQETMPGLFRDPAPLRLSRGLVDGPSGKKRVETYWVPELGKNVVPIKVWLPRRLRSDLQSLADHVGIPLSQYVREIVISRVLGHGTLPRRKEMMDAVALPSADDWCANKEVPMRQVEQAQWAKVAEGEVRTAWTE